MSYVETKRQYLAIWLIIANLVVMTAAIAAVLTTFSTFKAHAHEDEIHQQVVTNTVAKMDDGQMMLDLNLSNYSGREIDVQMLSIDGIALSAIDQRLPDSKSLELAGEQSIEIPKQYLGSMFLSLELDLGRDGTMTIPVIVSN